MTPITILALQSPQDCLLTGLCGIGPERVGPPSGLMYLAVGLVAVGVAGLIRLRRPPPTAP